MTPSTPIASRFRARLLPLALLLPLLALPAAAVESNGSGGGPWRAGSSWAGGLGPVRESWVIRAGDAVHMQDGDVFESENTDNQVLGSLKIDAGARVRMRRLNTQTGDQGGTIHVDGGELDIGRWVNRATVRVDGGRFVSRDQIAIMTDGLLEIRGGEVSLGGTLQTPTRLHQGGRLVFAYGVRDLQGLTHPAKGAWQGGTLVVNNCTLSSTGRERFIESWGGHPENLLVLSDAPERKTLTLRGDVFLSRGRLQVKVYSSGTDDNDRVVVEEGGLAVGAAVQVIVEGAGLRGDPSEYVGRGYRLFSGPGSLAGVGPSVLPAVWRIGGVDYEVSWSNTLARDGRLTVAALTELAPREVARAGR